MCRRTCKDCRKSHRTQLNNKITTFMWSDGHPLTVSSGGP